MGTRAAIIRDLDDGIEVTYRHQDGFLHNVYIDIQVAIAEDRLDEYFTDTDEYTDWISWVDEVWTSFNLILWIKKDQLYIVVDSQYLIEVKRLIEI